VVSHHPDQDVCPHIVTREPSSSWVTRTSHECAFQQEVARSDLGETRRKQGGTTWERAGKQPEVQTRAPATHFSFQRIIPAARTRDANTRWPARKPGRNTLITHLARTAATDWLSSTNSFLHTQDKRCRFLRRQVVIRFHTHEACALLVYTGQGARILKTLIRNQPIVHRYAARR